MRISPEEARANIIKAYTKQHEAAVNGLTAAMEQERATRHGKAVRKPTVIENVVDSLSDALKRARMRQSD